MWVSASEKSLRERIVSAGSDPLEASIAARYRHGLDIEIPALSERVFVSTAAKGLFPSHFAVRQPVLEALLQKPVGSHLWIRTDSQDRTAPDALTLSYRTFDLYLPDNLTGTPDPKRLVSRSRVLRSTLLLIASSGGLDPFTAMFSDTWEHRGRSRVAAKRPTRSSGFSGKARAQPRPATICWSALPRSVHFLKMLKDRSPTSRPRGSRPSLAASPGSPLSPP